MKTYYLRPPALKPIATAKHVDDEQCPDGAWHPLTKKQKARLSILAHEAAVRLGLSTRTKELKEWRQAEAIKACGRPISAALQENWADLKSAFEDLSGNSGKAFKTQMREVDNKRRVAMHKLTEALRAKDLSPSYAASICRAQFKTSLEEATAKQLWCLFFTVTNRKKS